ncbi:MAG: hypothetical protein EZS28_047879, partial [Streblomastix strix]
MKKLFSGEEAEYEIKKYDQLKRRVDTTLSELEIQKTKINQSQKLVSVFQQQVETSQSELTRLTTEVQRLTSELSKLKPITTSPKQQSKPEPKRQQIQQSVPPCLNTNIPQGIIPDKKHCYQEGSKIIHTDKKGCSTVAFNPVLSSGIARFEGYFKDHPNSYFIIGIADSSAVFGSNESPSQSGNKKKTVCYWRDGGLEHIGDYIPGNSKIEENRTVSCEVNMDIAPRTLTFFYENQ